MFERLKHNTGLVGLDVSGNTARLVELQKTQQNYRVTACTAVTATNAVLALQQLRQQYHKKIKAAAAIPYSKTLIKTISLDAALTELEIQRYLQANIQKYTGIAAANLNMDFEILGPNAKYTDQIDIEVVATKKDQVVDRLTMAQKAKIKITALDVDIFALQRAVMLQPREQVCAIINFAGQHCLLGVLKQQHLIYIKEIQLTNQTDAVKLIYQALQMFCAAQHTVIEAIILGGDITPKTKLPNLIAAQCNIPTSLANPFQDMEIAPEVDSNLLHETAPSMMISCGLALRWHNNA